MVNGFNPYTAKPVITPGWYRKKVSITSSQLLNIFTTPVQLLPALTGNKYYVIEHSQCRINFGGTVYATRLNLVAVNDLTNREPVLFNGFVIQRPQTTICSFNLTGSPSNVANQQITQAGLYLTVQTGNPTAGNGTLDVWINYRVIDLG